MGGGTSITRYFHSTFQLNICNICIHKKVNLFIQKIVKPTKIERWAVVNFSARCDIRGLVRDLIKCGNMKGIVSFITAI